MARRLLVMSRSTRPRRRGSWSHRTREHGFPGVVVILTVFAVFAIPVGVWLWVKAWHTPPDVNRRMIRHLRTRYPEGET